jgi:hypothetical protein
VANKGHWACLASLFVKGFTKSFSRHSQAAECIRPGKLAPKLAPGALGWRLAQAPYKGVEILDYLAGRVGHAPEG